MLVMWLGLLAALIYTSANGVSATVRTGFVSVSGITQPNIARTREVILLFVTLVMLALLGWQLVTAWLRFGQLTVNLLTAYARPDPDDNVFAKMLFLSRPNQVVATSYLSEVLRPIAYSWVIIVITPSLSQFVTMLLTLNTLSGEFST
jgi:hypothetical protein